MPKADLSYTVGHRVVHLPTAARRQVQQRRNKHYRAEKARLIMEQGDRFEFIFPAIRAKLDDAQRIRSVDNTPALLLARAMFESLDDASKMKVAAFLAVMDIKGYREAKTVMALVKPVRTVGEQVDLSNALDIVDRRNGL